MRYGLALLLSALTSVLHHNCSALTLSLVNGRRTRTSLHRAATGILEPATTTLSTISVTLPYNWNDNNSPTNSWSAEAAAILNEYGAVALVSETTDDNKQKDSGGLIKHKICDTANQSIISRVKEMHRRIESRGVDPHGIDEPYRFAEIICRDDGGRRYDVPVPWLGETKHTKCTPTGVGSFRIGAPLKSGEEESIAELHTSIGIVVGSVMDALWSNNSRNNNQSSYVAAAGFLMNEPGSNSQYWHRDGPDEGFIDCFVPLIDLNESIGPTAIQPGTHRMTSRVGDYKNEKGEFAPLLNKGDILLFDYRTIHRGLGNVSKSTTRTLAYAVYRRREAGSSDSIGDVRNFQAALTLEYD